MRGWFWVLLLPFGFLVPPAGADILVVHPDGSGEYPNLRAAISAAQDGDVIELTDGIFSGDDNCNLHVFISLTIRSQSDCAETCIIDCSGGPPDSTRRAFDLVGELASMVIRGITIANGHTGSG